MTDNIRLLRVMASNGNVTAAAFIGLLQTTKDERTRQALIQQIETYLSEIPQATQVGPTEYKTTITDWGGYRE